MKNDHSIPSKYFYSYLKLGFATSTVQVVMLVSRQTGVKRIMRAMVYLIEQIRNFC